MKFLLSILFGLSLSIPTFAEEGSDTDNKGKPETLIQENAVDDTVSFEVKYTNNSNQTDDELNTLVRNFTLFFGPTRIFTTKSFRFFITNYRFVPLWIHNISIFGNGFFRTENCPEFLFFGQRCAVRVFFHPTRLGQHQGQLFVNMTGQEDIRVFLFGRGVLFPTAH